MNTYTLEEVRQRELEAGGRRKEKVRREKVFYHAIIRTLYKKKWMGIVNDLPFRVL
ncbi:MAG: hypothetical protein F6K54_14210 [Okeania sp. SIO3B5]|uniref:hypothetical protein n=1 Tax=Okeania sp. SIO3B5 TaxID=2607811 RepID=UPI0013FF3D4E|nr:hypothetical protein [Okeania sp. SIO3B5]NEO54135.1 hypothetical protein [Okeania sp. SIO3B5]